MTWKPFVPIRPHWRVFKRPTIRRFKGKGQRMIPTLSSIGLWPGEDSLRIYTLHAPREKVVECHGINTYVDFKAPLVV